MLRMIKIMPYQKLVRFYSNFRDMRVYTLIDRGNGTRLVYRDGVRTIIANVPREIDGLMEKFLSREATPEEMSELMNRGSNSIERNNQQNIVGGNK